MDENKISIIISLSRVIRDFPEFLKKILNYFDHLPEPWEVSQTVSISDEWFHSNAHAILEAVLHITESIPSYCRRRWRWSTFVTSVLKSEDLYIRWLACRCFSIIIQMSESQYNKLVATFIPEEDVRVNHQMTYFERVFTGEFNISESPVIFWHHFVTGGIGYIDVDAVPNVTNVIRDYHTLMSMFKISTKSDDSILGVYLNTLQVAITTGKPACITGPVGCGKTSLVHFAACTEEILQIQLGEQMDSKLLLGGYHCTDVPGEFIWQPGVLTRAVLEGKWLLMEDIDLATGDVLAVVLSLIERNLLSVPGYRDNITPTPGFQLFFTQRTMDGFQGYFQHKLSLLEALRKYWVQIDMNKLSREELLYLFKNRFSYLNTISERILDVFEIFTDFSDNNKLLEQFGENVRNILRSNSRLMSMRDLFKWCYRIKLVYKAGDPESILKIVQDAIDLFCCNIPDEEVRLIMASELTTRLGVVRNKAEYFCKDYKPVIAASNHIYKIGRCSLKIKTDTELTNFLQTQSVNQYAMTRVASCLMESVACCIQANEPVLLVGETGTGKTTTLQLLARSVGTKLVVLNMNQQSDTADLLGGYKPVDLKSIIGPVRNEFETLFRKLYVLLPENLKYLDHVSNCFNGRRWNQLLTIMNKVHNKAIERLSERDPDGCLNLWTDLGSKINKIQFQLKHGQTFGFKFVEGALVRALQEGYWVLLDEINLATPETLQCLAGILDGSGISLYERGDSKPLKQHQAFRLMAAMNPATDIGKKQLPQSIRNRFTEFFVNELTSRTDLNILVSCYLPNLTAAKVDALVKFYLAARKEAATNLSDGTGHRPHYSLRTLCRALSVAATNKCRSVSRSLYEGLCLSFLTQLDETSNKTMREFITKTILGSNKNVLLNQPIPEPEPLNSHIFVEGFWIAKGTQEIIVPEKYILTDHIKMNLSDLLRIVSLSNHPTLIQGDTSVGKTSLITYLASLSGNTCLRINNHEHTDVQEYTGTYSVDVVSGHLIFKEGVLVEAMRNGYWIILDELNLAPSEVLEALNRVLDDNRELYIPETQTTVKAHPNFRIFATQNPPGIYGGRKALSRAFRNRFIELHFGEIPAKQLEIILQKKCELPASYAIKMVTVMKDLQIHRKDSAAFAGKQGFVTLRDLFRWGERYRLAANMNDKTFYDWDQHIAEEGLLVLAGRVRKKEEFRLVADILEKHIKRKIDLERLFTLSDNTSVVTRHILQEYTKQSIPGFEQFVWTYNMRMVIVLVGKALEFNEPILLVGNTGCGKTSLCQLIATRLNRRLFTVNCHQHTESSDFLGGLRPIRNRTENSDSLDLFEWVDGPLIESMKTGNLFLADEICLADDSVLERLNSLLEPERTLLLNEKPNTESDFGLIKAHDNFRFLSTMNPGDDFGKKELSPALRNRLTEIWCESINERDDLIAILDHNLKRPMYFSSNVRVKSLGTLIVEIVEMIEAHSSILRFVYSIRDLLLWVEFINATQRLPLDYSFLTGASLVFLDKIGINDTLSTSCDNCNLNDLKMKLKNQMKQIISEGSWLFNNIQCPVDDKNSRRVVAAEENSFITTRGSKVGCDPFFIERGTLTQSSQDPHYVIAGSTLENFKRLFAALQVSGKAILLEGHPGVGKTSLIENLASITGHPLVRINLSEQTDVSDLFGADLPVDGAIGGTFAWKDGPFLKALKDGHWILLDEINLASQSVLEGLNAVLDHRGELYIPELGRVFKINSRTTRIFACQNPASLGGARKKLAKSFLNRFVQVFVEQLDDDDLFMIFSNVYPLISRDIIKRMIAFNTFLSKVPALQLSSVGGPWEMNIRDLSRWFQLVHVFSRDNMFKPEQFIDFIYKNRIRTFKDREIIDDARSTIFIDSITSIPDMDYFHVTSDYVILGDVKTERADIASKCENTDSFEYSDIPAITDSRNYKLVLDCQKVVLYSLAICDQMRWLSILIGPSCSGKVSVVKTFAQLCNRKLEILSMNSAMDSMDIIGGFEQVDYSRHLEEIAAKAEQYLYAISQRLLLSQATNADDVCDKVATLFRCWENYRDIKHDAETFSTLASEINLRVRRLDALEQFLNVAYDFHIYDRNHDELKAELSALKNKIKNNDSASANSGGRFEWVDSVLIKCVTRGYWLLIENANLCSPAVLDRLNSLLEPNGVLIVGEKGVNADENFVAIQPHPNFRLFFTMDPARGELSRAMRNRGVEIVLMEPDYCELSFDNIAVLHSFGLFPFVLKLALIKFHQIMSECQIGSYDKIKNSHLERAAFLIGYRFRCGFSYYEAFEFGCENVYLRSRNISIEDKTLLGEFVRERVLHMKKIDFEHVLYQWYDSLTPFANTTDTYRIQRDSLYQTIRKDVDFFLLTCTILRVQSVKGLSKFSFEELFSRMLHLSVSSPPSRRNNDLLLFINHSATIDVDPYEALKCCLYHVYAVSNVGDAPLRRRWISFVLNKFNSNRHHHHNFTTKQAKNLQKLNSLFCHYLVDRSAYILENVFDDFSTYWPTPLTELPWNSEICPAMLQPTESETMIPIEYLLMNLAMLEKSTALQYYRDNDFTNQAYTSITIGQYASLSLTDPMRCSELNQHLVLSTFFYLVCRLKTFLENTFKCVNVSNECFTNFLRGFVMFKHFQDMGDLTVVVLTPDNGIVINQCVLEYLDVHYYWICKYLIPPLMKFVSFKSCYKKEFESIKKITRKISNSPTYATVSFQRLIHKTQKIMGFPRWNYVDENLSGLLENNRLWSPALALFKYDENECVSFRVMQFFTQFRDLRQYVIDSYRTVLDNNSGEDLFAVDLIDTPPLSIDTNKIMEFVHKGSIELYDVSGIFCHRLECRLWNDIINCPQTDGMIMSIMNKLPNLVLSLPYKDPFYTTLLHNFFRNATTTDYDCFKMLMLVELAEQTRFGSLLIPLRIPDMTAEKYRYFRSYVPHTSEQTYSQNPLPMLDATLCIMINGHFLIRSNQSSMSNIRFGPLSRYHKVRTTVLHLKSVLWNSAVLIHDQHWNYRLNELDSAKGQYCHFLSSFMVAMKNVVDININFTVNTFEALRLDDIKLVTRAIKKFITEQCQDLSSFKHALITVLERMTKLIDFIYNKQLSPFISPSESEPQWKIIGEIWVNIGLLVLDLFSFVPSFDINNKTSCKNAIGAQEISRLRTLLGMEYLYANVTGNYYNTNISTTLDELLLDWESKIADNYTKNEITVMPFNETYSTLVQNIREYFNNGNYERVKRISSDLSAICDDHYPACKIQDVFEEVDTWLRSHDLFVVNVMRPQMIRNSRCIIPLSYASTLYTRGIRILRATAQRHVFMRRDELQAVRNMLLQLAQVPSKLNSIFKILIPYLNGSLKVLPTALGGPSSVNMENFNFSCHLSIVKISFEDFASILFVIKSWDVKKVNECWRFLSKILSDIMQHWLKCKETEDQKKLLDECLFIRKSAVSLTNDELEDDNGEIDKFFTDNISEDLVYDLDDPNVTQRQTDNFDDAGQSPDDRDWLLGYNDDEASVINTLHFCMCTMSPSLLWCSNPREFFNKSIIMRVESLSFRNRYTLFDTLFCHCPFLLDSDDDGRLVPGFLSMLNIMDARFNSNDNYQMYDFCRNPNVIEAKSLLDALAGFEEKLQEVMSDVQDHPLLISISLVLKRLLEFDVMSPFLKFIEGSEMLLNRLNHWNEYASSSISFNEYAKVLESLIIYWRRSQIYDWKKTFDYVADRIRRSDTKYWFYLHYLCLSFLKSIDTEISCEDMVKSLHRFMETSNLVTFRQRLSMLVAFHFQFMNYKQYDKSNILCYILWNIHSFYAVFCEQIASYYEESVRPIYKDLSDYLKIIKNNERNLFRTKNVLVSSLKVLSKHVRKFEKLSRTQICFVIKQAPFAELTDTTSSVHMFANVQDMNIFLSLIELQYGFSLSKQEMKRHDVLLKISKDITNYSFYRRLLASLDDYITNVAEIMGDINTLKVDVQADKDKQRSEAKNILQRKKKIFSDLFKQLNNIGLSYKTGLLGGKNEDYFISFASIQPVDIEEAMKLIDNGTTDPVLVEAWQGCEHKFLTCIKHYSFLEKNVEKPHNDIGPMYLDRIKGFASHIMQIIFHQRKRISESTNKFYVLRAMESLLHKMPIPSHMDIYSDLVRLKAKLLTVIDETIYFLSGFLTLLRTYKKAPSDSNSSLGELTKTIAGIYDMSNIYSTFSTIEFSQQILINMKNNLIDATKFDRTLYQSRIESIVKKDFLLDDCTMKQDHFITMFFCYDQLKSVCGKLIVLLSISEPTTLSDFNNGDINVDQATVKHPICLKFVKIFRNLENVTCEIGRYVNCKEADRPRFIRHPFVSDEAGGVCEKLLIRLQNVYKKCQSDRNHFEGLSPSLTTSDDSLNMWTHTLKYCLADAVNDDLEVLEIDYVLKHIETLVKSDETIYTTGKTSTTLFFTVLHQYTRIVQYYLTQQVYTFNLSTRLCLLLLDIFTTLSTQGFNIPQDLLTDEQQRENTSRDKGGMGLSNDEVGTKDVSDQIDSLDDLEDALLPGQEDKQQEEFCEEEKNGIEMTDDFGGKSFDLDKDEKKDEGSEDDNDDENMDKEMGELDSNAECLDQSIWGADENDDIDDETDKNEIDEINGETTGTQTNGQYDAKDERTNESKENPLDKNEPDKQGESQKEINEIDEPPVDDDQIDPYHGNQPPLPEPEEFDMPADLHFDGDDGDNDNNEEGRDEENPLDIDTMKNQIMPDQDKMEESTSEEKLEQPDEVSSDDHDKLDETEAKPDENIEGQPDEQQVGEDELMQDDDNSGENDEQKTTDGGKKDENKIGDEPKKDELSENTNAEASRDKASVDTAQCAQNAYDGSKDMVVDNENDKIDKNDRENSDSDAGGDDDTTGAEEHGVGTAEKTTNDADKGHLGEEDKGSVNKNERSGSSKKRKNPGDTSDNRTLSNPDRIAKKRLKTLDVETDTRSNEQSKNDVENDTADENKDETVDESSAGLYEHIVEPEDSNNISETLDAATQNQLNQQAVPNREDEIGEELKADDDMEISEGENVEEEKAETNQNTAQQLEASDLMKMNKINNVNNDSQDSDDEDMPDTNVDGEIVNTLNVERGTESMYHIPSDMLVNTEQISIQDVEILKLQAQIHEVLGSEEMSFEDARSLWNSISSSVQSLSHELSDQLRLILEPTQASQLKGDFRTGRRINMKKVIPYIASQFRKDKIWLRRTKPSKRTYQIILAIDNSSSMDDNHSKQLAFQSVAVLSKALETIEVGQLGILSFGKTCRILHRLNEALGSETGVRLLQEITFKEDETCTTDMMKLALGMFLTEANNVGYGEKPAQLLMIISDGRGVASTGVNALEHVIGQVKQCNIFTVFIIVENPDAKNSVYDIRQPIFEDGKLVGFEGYLEKFPFPFYMVLRDINKLPSVLSDALRQWFELVSNVP